MPKRSEKVVGAVNALMTLIKDVQKYDRIEIKPQFANELNAVVRSAVEVVKELETEERAKEATDE